MDEAEDGAEEDVEDTEDEPTSLIALFLKKTKIKVFFMEKKGQQWPLLLLLDIRTQSFTLFLTWQISVKRQSFSLVSKYLVHTLKP